MRQARNEKLAAEGVKLSVNDFLVRACALAMHSHPFVNSSWVANGPSIQLHGRVNIGVAVALPEERGGGLVVAPARARIARHGVYAPALVVGNLGYAVATPI